MNHMRKRASIAGALVVVALSAIVVFLLVTNPRVVGSVDKASEMISSTILLSRQKAVAGNTRYGIKYDDNVFRVYRNDAEGQWVLDPPDNEFTLPQHVSISSGGKPDGGWIVIDSSGAIEAKQLPVILNLQDDDGHRLSIKIQKSGNVQQSSGW